MQQFNIVVIGGTGTVGQHLVDHLVEKDVLFSTITRSIEKAQALKERGISCYVGDASDANFLNTVLSARTVLFLLTAPDKNQVFLQKSIIEVAKANEVRHIVKLSVIGAGLIPDLNLSNWHYETDEYLRHSGINYTTLHPTGFNEGMFNHMATITSMNTIFSAETGGNPTIAAADIGAVAAHILMHPQDHVNQSYNLKGPTEITYAEMTEIISDIRERALQLQLVRIDRVREVFNSMHMPAWLVDDLCLMIEMTNKGTWPELENHFKKVMGRPPMHFKEWTLRNQGVFKSA